MIGEKIHPKLKLGHVRKGDADVFGDDSDRRRSMDDEECLSRFAEVWRVTLEPEIRKAPIVTAEDAREMLESKLHGYVEEGAEFRQFSLHFVPFLARLTRRSGELVCDQLWSLGKHKDNTRLSVYFRTIDLRERFESVSQRLGWDSSKLAEKILVDFMNTVDRGSK
jgi:hypothetical protein